MSGSKSVNQLPIATRQLKGYFRDKDRLVPLLDDNSYFDINQYGDNTLRLFSSKKVLIDSEDEIILEATNKINILAPQVNISGMTGSNSTQSLAEIINKVNNNESSINMLTDFKSGAESRFTRIEQKSSNDRSYVDVLAGRVQTNESSIANLQLDVTEESIKAKISSEINRISDLEKNTASLSETINTVDQEGKAIAGQIVSQIGNFELLNTPFTPIDTTDKNKIYKAPENSGSQIYLYHYYDSANQQWKSTYDPLEAGCVVSSAGVITSINANGDSDIKIKADAVNLEGYATFTSLKTPGATEIDGGNIITQNLKLVSSNITNLDDSVTEISNGWIKSVAITAENLKVNAANINKLTADNIIVSDTSRLDKELEALNAEKNKTVVETHIYYGINQSTTSFDDITDSDWQEGVILEPSVENNEILWQKVEKIYDNSSIDETYLCLGKNNSATIVEISSISGDKIVAGEQSITLTARAVKGGFDITDNYPDDAFTWTKYDIHGQSTSWSHAGKEILVGCDDIIKKAVFNCELDLDKEIKK